MEVLKETPRQTIEPQFLSEAQISSVKLRVGQMNKAEHEGTILDIGRYEINIEESGGRIVTILKQEIAYLSAPEPILTPQTFPAEPAARQERAGSSQPSKPNIQQEFLDKSIKENQVLTLFLVNGQRIKATIEGYDNFTILLREGGKQHLYYKHAITTINR